MFLRYLGVALAAIAVAVQIAAAAEPDSTALAQSMAAADRVRVTVATGAFVVTRPRVGGEALYFRGVEGYPPRRRALLVSSKLPPPPEPPKSPLAWSEIQRIERPFRSYGPGTPVGGVLGLLGGMALGIPVGYAAGLATDSGTAAYVVFAACAVGGAAIGAKAMGETEEWLELHPERPPVAVPDSRRR